MTEPAAAPAAAPRHHMIPSWLSVTGAAPAFLPAAALIGITGAIINQGHDALALSLGLAGAAFLWATHLIPTVGPAAGTTPIPAGLARRFQSPAVGAMASAILICALLILLTAELIAVSGALAALLQGFPVSPLMIVTAVLAAASLIRWAAGGSRAAASAARLAAAVPLAVIALLACLALLSGHDGPGAIAGSPALPDIANLERGLIEKHLADPALFKPFASPFLRSNAVNTLAVIVCISIGFAILASSSLHTSNPLAPAERNRPRVMLLAMIALGLIAPLAVAARRLLLMTVDGGLKADSLPPWLMNLRPSSALEVCGTPSWSGAAALGKACGKGAGAQGFMRWHDFSFAPDGVLMSVLTAQPDTILTNAAIALVLIAAGLAALATARHAAQVFFAAFARLAGDPPPQRSWAMFVIVATTWLLAALFAATKPAPAATLLVWAAAIAAGGLAPALAASRVENPSRIAALIALPAGALTALGLILLTRYDAMDAIALTTAFEPLSPPAMRKLSTLWSALSVAQGEVAQAPILAQMQDLARDNVSWLGLKQLAAGTWGLVTGTIVMAAGQGVSALSRRLRSA